MDQSQTSYGTLNKAGLILLTNKWPKLFDDIIILILKIEYLACVIVLTMMNDAIV